ncbi:WD repeat-containing 6 [Brachionus plicatilis]|uniref:tRNA (34-2'-O)-methyltransferase regulator WDR6 n=1 Tax=Brachionus plicatilis TaxID=10195 RepID=A0A3M7S9X4_BRAPC|nr:WD repeat-containing 6 [Brachionus plicatilis]
MEGEFLPLFYKGPITSCEYLDSEKILIGYGPYLSLIDESSSEEISKFIALKYRVIHKIVINPTLRNQICIFGQKAFNLVSLDNNIFSNIIDQYVELDDWILDMYWMEDGKNSLVAILLAHNKCIIYNLQTNTIKKIIECSQKCMLYTAKIFNNKAFEEEENLLIASGTIFNEVLIWSLKNGTILLNLKGHQGVIFNIEYSHQTNNIYSTSDDRSINVWKINLNDQSGQLYTRFYGHDARVWKCKAFLKDNTEFLCSIGEDLKCCLWNVEDKSLIYRLDAMRKGSKNIWSLAVNEAKLQIVTGWADGGLRKFDLNHYLISKEDQNDSADKRQESAELELNLENEKDFIRSTVLINSRVICCTNLGFLYMIDLINQQQKLLFKSILLSNFNTMAKNYVDTNHCCLAIGSLKGFVYLLNLKFQDKNTGDLITIDCINCLGIEEEIAESNADSSTKFSLLTHGSSKIFNILWLKCHKSSFLLVCFSLLNGLTHLYELKSSKQLKLVARLYLPACKHRWFTSAAIITIKSPNVGEESTDSENLRQEMHLIGGDKCGNLHLYRLDVVLDSSSEDCEDNSELKLVKPSESISNVTKENSPISAIYARNLNQTDGEILNYRIICCCKDGFYRIFELNSNCFSELDAEESQSGESEKLTKPMAKSMLKLINKYQINSYIDLIEEFIFDSDERKEYSLLNNVDQKLSFWEKNNLELSLKLALCFYGDKFMLWNFQLNRALFESKCGGANRSWDFEFMESRNDENLIFRFVYVKSKSISENRKVLFRSEIERPMSQTRNHLCQIFHGNTITINKFIASSKYLLTGSEDTQLIVTKINDDKCFNLVHEFHLQGHDSVIKCMDFYPLNEAEFLLITAGGKANIKIWKIIFSQNRENIERIISLYEFKRKLLNGAKNDSKSSISEKPWLYIDLKSNPDIRFMDVCVIKKDSDPVLCFACSDGCIRIFRYSIETNKLYLINKYEYPKCLLCIRRLTINDESYLLAFGTDGNLLFWRTNSLDDQIPQIISELNQSGINDVDLILLPDSRQALVATVGDDTCLSLVKIEVSTEQKVKMVSQIVKFEMSHASAIAGVRFLLPNLMATVSKDQRLVVWKIDLENKKKSPVKVYFCNVPDVSSLDIIKLNDGWFRFSLVGVGMEIIDFKLINR